MKVPVVIQDNSGAPDSLQLYLPACYSKGVEIPATVTSKGQITIPAEVRKALGLQTGDRVVFRVVDGRAILHPEEGTAGEEAPGAELEKVPDFFDLAGTVSVPPGVEPGDWPAHRAAAWAAAVRDRE